MKVCIIHRRRGERSDSRNWISEAIYARVWYIDYFEFSELD